MEDKTIVNQIATKDARSISEASTLKIDGPPISGANVTLTKAYRVYCSACHAGIEVDSSGVLSAP